MLLDGFHTLVLMHRSQVFPEAGKRVVALVDRLHIDWCVESRERFFWRRLVRR